VAQIRVKWERVEIMVPGRKFIIWLARFGLILLGALAVTVWIIALLVILLILILIAVAPKRSWRILFLIVGGFMLLGMATPSLARSKDVRAPTSAHP
jgi:hypothetical protein